MGLIYLPHRRLHHGVSNYSSWDEASEAGLAAADIFTAFLENAAASGDETGQGGGLSGADLVLSQGGSLAGAVGTPPYRTFDGNDDYMLATDTLLDLLTGAEFTLLYKLENVANHQLASEDYLSYLRDPANGWLRIDREADDSIAMTVEASAHALAGCGTATLVYFAFWRGSGYNTRCGWTTSGSGANGQPTKWSDFDAANRADHGSAWSPASGAWVQDQIFGFNGSNQTAGFRAYYVIVASTCLIDNAS